MRDNTRECYRPDPATNGWRTECLRDADANLDVEGHSVTDRLLRQAPALQVRKVKEDWYRILDFLAKIEQGQLSS